MEEEEKKPLHRGLKKGLYVIPTAFTAANIAMGFIAVLYSIRGYHLSFDDPISASWYFNRAAIAIGLAILFDTLDGRVARMTKTATCNSTTAIAPQACPRVLSSSQHFPGATTGRHVRRGPTP